MFYSFQNLQNKLHVGLATMCRCSHSDNFRRGDGKNLVLQLWYFEVSVFRISRYSLHEPECIMNNYTTEKSQGTLKNFFK